MSPIIRVIGFDLDQTLYSKSPDIDSAIQQYIYERIADHKGCSLKEAQQLFYKHYPRLSGRATLVLLGVPYAQEIVQEALEKADIASFLKPDPMVHSFLQELIQKYGSISLITGSNRSIAIKKLASLGIPLEWFDVFITGEISKSDGTAFQEWLTLCQKKDPTLVPAHFLYVGDRYPADVDPPLGLGMNACLVNISKPDPACPVPQYRSLLDLRSLLL